METTSSKQQQHVIQPTYSVAMVAFEKWRYRLYHVDIIFTFFFFNNVLFLVNTLFGFEYAGRDEFLAWHSV